jgi:uncharacterized protein YjbJ (UPF0337 family)
LHSFEQAGMKACTTKVEETIMNSDTLKGQWHQVKGEVKTQWGKLTDSDLDQIAGQSEKLVGVIQERYGYARDRAEKEVSDFKANTEAEADDNRIH